MRKNSLLGTLLIFVVASIPADAEKQKSLKLPPAFKGKVEFVKQIRPILEQKCFKCHGPEKQKSGLRLDAKKAALQGGDDGPVFVAGKPAESEIIKRIVGHDPDEIMPPKGDPLTAGQIGLFVAWIEQGAAWPDDGIEVRTKTKHWAFQAPKRPDVPKISERITNPIDAFVLARLKTKAIKPSPTADLYTLGRRLSLDLTGLPPTTDEITAFINDKKEGAYERLVDRLLQSQHFGERWAKHWLDLGRYADSDGYEKDLPRPNAWRWRDWVIEAINRDLPFDQFTVQQLAGDMLPGATDEVRVATGFHRNTLTNREGGVDQEEYRIKAVKDRLNTTFGVWMGLTMGCAECHTHKYDPITQREYYKLFDFFNNADETDIKKKDSHPDKVAAFEKAKVAHDKKLADLQAKLDKSKQGLAAKLPAWEQSQKQDTIPWKAVDVASLNSSGRAVLKAQKDGSILAENHGAEETFTITAKTGLSKITAVKLEAFPEKGNTEPFTLNNLDIQAKPTNAKAAGGHLTLSMALSDAGEGASDAIIKNGKGWSASRSKQAALSVEILQSPSKGGWLGHLKKEGGNDGATQMLNLFYSSPIPGTGKVDQFRLFSQVGPGIDFSVYLFRSMGGTKYQIVYKEDFKSVGPQGILTYKLKQPWDVQAGDLFAHSNRGGPAFTAGPNNLKDVLYYPLGSFPGVGEWDLKGQPVFKQKRTYMMQMNFIPAATQQEFVKPAWGKGGAELTFVLTHKPGHALGQFRLFVTDQRSPLAQKAKLPKNIAQILRIDPTKRNDKQRDKLLTHLASADKGYQKIRKELDRHKKKSPKLPVVVHHAMQHRASPRASHIHIRGNFLTKGDAVQPGTPSFMPEIKPRDKRPDRLDLARWIVDKRNPLTARVAVNHIWKHLFGYGIVRTTEDFGTQGEKPSHPELLDWLATEFPTMNWSRKKLIKLLVSSNTYKQSSANRPDLSQADPLNRFLARQNRFRIEAETVRDQYLSSSGLLNRRVGGPSFRPMLPAGVKGVQFVNKWNADKGDILYSRGLYIHLQRNLMMPMLMTFDHPDGIISCTRRERSNTPLQALTLLNSPIFVESAKALGKKLASESAKSRDERIQQAFLTVVGRPPSEKELAIVQNLFDQLNALYKADAEAAKALAGEPHKDIPVEDSATWIAVARTVMNMDEVITRE